MTFLCRACIDHDEFFHHAEDKFYYSDCDNCRANESLGIEISQLAAVIDPLLRSHFSRVDEYMLRRGIGNELDINETLRHLFGATLPLETEIIDDLRTTERKLPKGNLFYGKSAFYWSRENNDIREQIAKWENTLKELKYKYRFFSPSVQNLFSDLFSDAENLVTDDGFPVTQIMKRGTPLFRARKFTSIDQREEFKNDPENQLGPVPSKYARHNRMSPEKVSYLYTSLDRETCVAELRPAIGEQIMTAQFEARRDLYLFDFRRLERAKFAGRIYSVFHPDHKEYDARRSLLRHLHTLISMPVNDGQEEDYLITQTMAEYLAHVHHPPFDGIAFRSSQRAGGTNVVLFPERTETGTCCEIYKVKLTANSLHPYKVSAIQYSLDNAQLNDSPYFGNYSRNACFSDMDDDIPF